MSNSTGASPTALVLYPTTSPFNDSGTIRSQLVTPAILPTTGPTQYVNSSVITVSPTPTAGVSLSATAGPSQASPSTSEVAIEPSQGPTSGSPQSIVSKNVIIAILTVLVMVFIVLFSWTARQLTFARRKLKSFQSSATEPLLSSSSTIREKPKRGLLGVSYISNLSSFTQRSVPSTRSRSPDYDHPASIQRPQSSSTYVSSSTISSSACPVATATYAFNPTRPDELPLTIGSRVRVIASFNDGWACISDESGKRGMVPCECLDIFEDSNTSDSRDYDESQIWDNYSEAGKRLSNVTGTSEMSRLTGRTNFSERTTSLSYTSEGSSVTADFIWFTPGTRSGLNS